MLVFIDLVAPSLYDGASVATGNSGVGGAEMTLVRVAEKLGEKHDVYVAQHNRKENTSYGNVQYICFDELSNLRPRAAIVMREVTHLAKVRKVFKKPVPLFLWMHNWAELPPLRWYHWPLSVFLANRVAKRIVDADATVVAVSLAHQRNLEGYVRASGLNIYAPRVKRTFVYNPVCVPEFPTDRKHEFDHNKLVFLSSDFAGRRRQAVLAAFSEVRRHIPELMLYCASPPYDRGRGDGGLLPENVVDLGHLSHAEAISQASTALCMFCPVDLVPEAFGLVLAESMAVGTPVLTCRVGAAPEVLGEQAEEQLVEANDIDAIVELLRRWREPGGRPVVRRRRDFDIDVVAENWEKLFVS